MTKPSRALAFALVLATLLLAGCSDGIPADAVRVCMPPTGSISIGFYITPADDLGECIVVGDIAGTGVYRTPCDELGWTADEARTLLVGTPADGATIRVDGLDVDYGRSFVDYDVRVVVEAESAPTRVVHAAGTWGPYVSGESGCFRRVPSP